MTGRSPDALGGRPYIIPLFISHQGCLNRCVFCNQGGITGQEDGNVTGEWVRQEIERCLARPRHAGREVQVAFYGGSFTGLPPARQEELLGPAALFKEAGRVQRLRLSTRPDYVDSAAVALLRHYGVDVVELGIQSMDQAVLDRCRRGHTTGQSEAAVRLLRQAGFIVGGQLMIGLPGETRRSLRRGAEALACLRPHFVRLYPTVVIRDSQLAQDYQHGEYSPLSLGRAVVMAAWLKAFFTACEIPVVRIGLQSSESLTRAAIAGPCHPAFGELVLSRLLFRRLRRVLNRGQVQRLVLASADESVCRGQRGESLRRLASLGLIEGVRIEFSPALARGEFRVEHGSRS